MIAIEHLDEVETKKIDEIEIHQAEFEDKLGEFWGQETEPIATSRKVPDHELHEHGAWIFHTRFFP